MFYLQMTRDAYMPAEDEIALQIQFDIKEDIGLLVYDYCADGHAYSGGMSNADKSLIQHDSHMIIGWKKQELNSSSDAVELSIQFRIITEYVAPNYENIYPDAITRYMEPISWEARFGESYCIAITGDKTNGYKAARLSKKPWERVRETEPFRASIVPGGVYGRDGAIFAAENPIFQSKNRFFAVSAPGNP